MSYGLKKGFSNGRTSVVRAGKGLAGSGGIPGKIVSGSEATYQVELYPDGPNHPAASEVEVTQLQIADGYSFPVDMWVFVFRAGAEYYMQAPVWIP